ncbi:MAG: hypothetical protein WDM89_21350 [Rhizomicrobium sp.]
MTAYSTEMQILFCVLVLGIVQLLVAVLASVFARGLPVGGGSARRAGAPLGKFGRQA